MVRAQEAQHDAGEQQPGSVTDAKAKVAELEGDHPDHQANDKEGAEGQQVGDLAVNRDKADAVCNGFNASRIAADLQNVAFVQHDVVVNWHLNLAADHAVEEATMIGQLQLRQTTADGVMVFHHNLFGDDTHIEQIAVKHLFTVAEARVEAGVGIRVTDQGNVIAHLQHGVAVRVCQNAVTANTFDIAACLAVNPQLAEVFPVRPCNQLGPNAVGANHGQIDFTLAVGVQTAFAGNLLSAGLQILVLQFWQVAGAHNQAHQTNQIGQGIAQAQVVERGRELRTGHAGVAQGIACTHQHRRGGHRAGEHTGRQPDIPAKQFTQS